MLCHLGQSLVPNIISACRPIFWSLLLGTYLCTGLQHKEITPYWFYPQNGHFFIHEIIPSSVFNVYVIPTIKFIGSEVRRQPIIENTTMENFNLNILLYVYLQMVIHIMHRYLLPTLKNMFHKKSENLIVKIDFCRSSNLYIIYTIYRVIHQAYLFPLFLK